MLSFMKKLGPKKKTKEDDQKDESQKDDDIEEVQPDDLKEKEDNKKKINRYMSFEEIENEDLERFRRFKDLLSIDDEVQNGDGGAPSGNPLYDLSTGSDAPSGNPLYDLDFSSGSGNPLYDLSTDVDSNVNANTDVPQDADPFADLAAPAETTPPATDTTADPTLEFTAPPANPLYDADPAPAGANPLYDLDSAFGTEPMAEPMAEPTAEPTASPVALDINSLDINSLDINSTVNAGDTGDLQVMDINSLDASASSQEGEFIVSGSVTTDMTSPEPSASADLLGDFGGGSSSLEETVTSGSGVIEEVTDGVTSEEVSEEITEVAAPQAQLLVEEQTQDGGQQSGDVIGTTELQLSDTGLDRQQFSSQVSDHRPEQNGVREEVSSLVVTEQEPEVESSPALSTMERVSMEVGEAEGGVYESEPKEVHEQWQNEEEEEEGVYESTPIKRDDVVREADRDITADLPAVGAASDLLNKWKTGQVESPSSSSTKTGGKRAITPPPHGTGGEYVSEPRAQMEQYQGQAEAGVFESEPQRAEDVVTSDTKVEEVFAEQGAARNLAARFKEIEKTNSSAKKREFRKEITPDRTTGASEFVSEPRKAAMVNEEQKGESGVFESEPAVNPDVVRHGEGREEVLPERGAAKGLAARYQQMGSDSGSYSTPRAKREITPDTTGQAGEHVSEPRAPALHVDEAPVDSGVFESTPTHDPNVVKSDQLAEDIRPEKGFAKNLASKFRELENTAKSPPLSPGRRKEFTPPREDQAVGVFESTPETKPDVVRSGESIEETVPEKGSTRNIANRFKQLESESKSPRSRGPKEFTPPLGDTGVFESNPTQTSFDYNRPAESGIIENEPIVRDDVVRGDEPPRHEVELPERGFARNRLSQWRQMEQASGSPTAPSSRGKEFTPPRDEPRIAQYRKSPRTPLSPGGNLDNGSVHPSDLPGQYQPQNTSEPSVFESQPNRLPDVHREEDTDWTAGMPKKDTAKKMLAKFQKIQSEVKPEDKPSPKKDSESDNRESESETESESRNSQSETRPEEDREQPEPPMDAARLKFEDPDKLGRSKSMRAAIQVEKCAVCGKTVYAMERLEMNGVVYHKTCFRCSVCNCVVTAKTFAINNGVIYCNTHYKQLFKTKGNYDEGFGRQQHKKRWGSNPNLATANGEEKAEAKS